MLKKQNLKGKKKKEANRPDSQESSIFQKLKRKLNLGFFVRGTVCKCAMLGKAAEGNRENPKNMVYGEITWQGFAQLPGSKRLSRKNQHKGTLPEEEMGLSTELSHLCENWTIQNH